jgi:hypothetical protein
VAQNATDRCGHLGGRDDRPSQVADVIGLFLGL